MTHMADAFPGLSWIMQKIWWAAPTEHNTDEDSSSSRSADAVNESAAEPDDEKPVSREEAIKLTKDLRLEIYKAHSEGERNDQDLKRQIMHLYMTVAFTFSSQECKEIFPEITLIPVTTSNNNTTPASTQGIGAQ